MSKTSVANEALLLLGETTIADIETDDSKEGAVVNAKFDTVRKALLRRHPWNFAIKRTSIAASVSTPSYHWDFQYQLPADFVRLLEVYETKDWKVEGDKILTNSESPLFIKYVADIEDDTDWDPLFKEIFITKLAMECAYALVTDEQIRKDLKSQYEYDLANAKAIDGTEDVPDEWAAGDGRFITAREDLYDYDGYRD